MLILSLLAVSSTSVFASRIYRTHTHEQHRRSEQDITHHVRYGSRMREYCDTGYWRNGVCEGGQTSVNWVVLDRGSERRCHYIVKMNNNVNKVYDATCDAQYLRTDFERAPISRHTYGDVYAIDPSEYRVAKNWNERQPGDPLYRSSSTLSLLTTFVVLALTLIA